MNSKRALVYVLAGIAVVGGALTYWGGNFATKTVHDQLAAQRIFFPKSEAEGLPADLTQYAGQQVDSGEKAKAYADKFIKLHIDESSKGRTYSEVSAEFLKNPKDQQLGQLRQTLFMGETLRGILLNAWGWGLIGQIALYASAAMFAGAVLFVILAGSHLLAAKKRPASRKRK
jgi:hypothetical protein